MAASYLSGHADEYAGLVLLGSYSTVDLSGSALEVRSVYGSEDTVLNREKYNENKAKLPEDFAALSQLRDFASGSVGFLIGHAGAMISGAK